MHGEFERQGWQRKEIRLPNLGILCQIRRRLLQFAPIPGLYIRSPSTNQRHFGIVIRNVDRSFRRTDFEAREIKWNALFTLGRRLEAGEEISAILHEHRAARGRFGFLEIVRLVALALDCYMGRGKQWALWQEVVPAWRLRGSPRHDDALNQALAALIAERFPSRAPNEP